MRSNDDRYRFWQFAHFEEKTDFERYWYGREFVRLARGLHELVPGAGDLTWFDRVVAGALEGNHVSP